MIKSKIFPILCFLTLFTTYSKTSNAQQQPCLTPDELRKIIIIKNERDYYRDAFKATTDAYGECKVQRNALDSTTRSLVQLDVQSQQTIKIMDIVNKEQRETIAQQKKAIRFRNTALYIGIPTSFLVGVVGGTYLLSSTFK